MTAETIVYPLSLLYEKRVYTSSADVYFFRYKCPFLLMFRKKYILAKPQGKYYTYQVQKEVLL